MLASHIIFDICVSVVWRKVVIYQNQNRFSTKMSENHCTICVTSHLTITLSVMYYINCL